MTAAAQFGCVNMRLVVLCITTIESHLARRGPHDALDAVCQPSAVQSRRGEARSVPIAQEANKFLHRMRVREKGLAHIPRRNPNKGESEGCDGHGGCGRVLHACCARVVFCRVCQKPTGRASGPRRHVSVSVVPAASATTLHSMCRVGEPRYVEGYRGIQVACGVSASLREREPDRRQNQV